MKTVNSKYIFDRIHVGTLARYHVLGLIPITIVIFLGCYFSDLVSYAIKTNLYLNGTILAVLLIGVCIMQSLIWQVRSEAKKMRAFVHMVSEEKDIAELAKEKRFANSDILQVFSFLQFDSHGLIKGNAIASADAGIRALRQSTDTRQELPQFLVGFMIAFGLLGTFIGILETLVQISQMIGGFGSLTQANMDQAFMTMISDLTKPLKGMGTAFSASMFGLVSSLCLGLTMLSVRHAIEVYVVEMRGGINRIIQQFGWEANMTVNGATPGAFNSNFLAEMLHHQRESLDMFHQSLEANVRVMQKVDTLELRLGDLAGVLEKQVLVSSETNDLLRDNPVTKQLATRFMAEIKMLAAAATENSQNVVSLLPALSDVTQRLSTFSDTLLSQRDQVQQTLLNTSESHGLLKTGLQSLLEKDGDIRAGMLGELTQMRAFVMELQPFSNNMVPLVTEINKRLNEQLIAMNHQQETLRFLTQSITQSSAGMKSGLSEMQFEAEKNRELHLEVITQMLTSPRNSVDLSVIGQSMKKMADTMANNLAVSQLMLDEVRNVRASVVREVRLDFQEMLNQHEQERAARAGASSKEHWHDREESVLDD